MRTRFVAAVSITLLLGGAGLLAAPASGDTSTLIGWTSQADANPFDLVVDNAAGLGGFHPVAEITLPEDSSDFETGPFGDALASIVWPGSALGNVGSLAGELGLPSPLASLADKANDPVRAQTFYPEGPPAASFPKGAPAGVVEMTSHADANGSWAKAGLTDVSVASLFQVQSAQGSTTATAGSRAQSTAVGSVGSVSFLGGLIQIGASKSSASASSDGVSPNGTSSTHIGAITIAGHQVSIGSDGLVVGPARTNLLGQLLTAPTVVVNELISILNLKITPLPATETSQAPTEQVTSGGLKVSFGLPSQTTLTIDCGILPPQLAQLGILCHLPDQLQGLNFTATIARVTATAIATPPFPLPTIPSGLPPVSPTGVSTGLTAPSPITAPPSLPPSAASTSTPAVNPTVAPVNQPAAPVGRLPAGLIPLSLSSPVKAGVLGSLLALALIIGLLARRMSVALDDPAPTACPLEEKQ